MEFPQSGEYEVVFHFVLGENEPSLQFAKYLAYDCGAVVTVVDQRYTGAEIRDNITYSDMATARHVFDIPDKLYLYSYMDPKKRKK